MTSRSLLRFRARHNGLNSITLSRPHRCVSNRHSAATERQTGHSSFEKRGTSRSTFKASVTGNRSAIGSSGVVSAAGTNVFIIDNTTCAYTLPDTSSSRRRFDKRCCATMPTPHRHAATSTRGERRVQGAALRVIAEPESSASWFGARATRCRGRRFRVTRHRQGEHPPPHRAPAQKALSPAKPQACRPHRASARSANRAYRAPIRHICEHLFGGQTDACVELAFVKSSECQNLETRLTVVEDRLAIYTLIASHPPSADTAAASYTREVYVEDGVFDRGPQLEGARGVDAIAAFTLKPEHERAIRGGLAHFSSLPLIDLRGDEAIVTSYIQIVHLDHDGQARELSNHGTSQGYRIHRVVVNRWQLVKIASQWKIRSRTILPVDGSDDALSLLSNGLSGVMAAR